MFFMWLVRYDQEVATREEDDFLTGAGLSMGRSRQGAKAPSRRTEWLSLQRDTPFAGSFRK